MKKNSVYQLVQRPKNQQVLPLLWTYRLKYDQNGNISKYKARLCVMGNHQIKAEGESNYSPVIHDLSLRTLLAFGCRFHMHIHQIDVCMAYLNSPINDTIYTEQPVGYSEGKDLVWLLRKSIYGLRSSAISWYKTIKDILIDIGFTVCKTDSCVFVLNHQKEIMIIGIYVDDALLISNALDLLINIKELISKRIEITDKGIISNFLNMDVKYDRKKGTLSIGMMNYIDQMLVEFGMNECFVKKTPMCTTSSIHDDMSSRLPDRSKFLSGLGRCIYLATKCRYDILYVVGQLCSVMNEPTEHHMSMLKHIYRFLKLTKDHQIHFVPSDSNHLLIYTDSDFSNDLVSSRSVTGVCTLLFNCLVNCMSRKQSTVATSTTQAEINSILEGSYDGIYIGDLIAEIDPNLKFTTTLYNDNQSSISTIRNGGDFAKNRHYRSKICCIREQLNKRDFRLTYVSTSDNLADGLTKPISGDKFRLNFERLNIW